MLHAPHEVTQKLTPSLPFGASFRAGPFAFEPRTSMVPATHKTGLEYGGGIVGGNDMDVTEGYLPYLGFRTYYRIVGSLDAPKPPLVLLHGGPGSTHNYFELLDRVAETGRAVVMYDQLGCGKSWDDEMADHPELWTYATWDGELIALREELGLSTCHLLGQSWGGMLAIEYLVNYRPAGVRSVVLSSSLPACWLWGEEQHRQMRYLPADERAAIAEGERTGRYDSPAFRAAQDHYMTLFCSGPASPDDPECLRRPKRAGRESYLATQGDNEFSPTGIFSTWDYLDRIHEIVQPTLVVSGTDDLCTPRIAKSMADRIPNASWELMTGCRHMCFADDTEGYVALLEAWLTEHD